MMMFEVCGRSRPVLWSYVLVLACLLAGRPVAADEPPVPVRGTVIRLAGDLLTVKTSAGEDAAVRLTPQTVIHGISLAKMSEIQPGRYIGTTALPQADGTLRAVEVHVFPPEMTGVGDGHRPWDLLPQSTMTNGAVGDLVTANGRTITVRYKTGEQKVVVPDDVPVVDIGPGDRSLLTPGVQVVLFASEQPDGTLAARSISAGKDGVKPPM